MAKLLATLFKELRLLGRDPSGLLILFAMPAALVVVFTLIQDNILKSSETLRIEVLWVDEDGGGLGPEMAEGLSARGGLTLVTRLEGDPLTAERAREAVAAGHFTAAVILPPGLSTRLTGGIEARLAAALSPASPPAATSGATSGPLQITLIFDPLVQGALHSAVTQALHSTLLEMEMELKAEALAVALPAMDTAFVRQPLLTLDARRIAPRGLKRLPTAVQQNVPAWALFGMFFIVVPLSGTLIRERRQGTLLRLRTLPVAQGIILAGKVGAYVLIAGLQFIMILALGRFLLPLLGTAVLTVGHSPLALILAVVSAALAAAGYGILLSTLAGSYEQASMFGSVSVVIAGALGGIMVPVYVMPAFMQRISGFSPLAWGLEALLQIFVQSAPLSAILPEICALLAFGAGCGLLALLVVKMGRGKG